MRPAVFALANKLRVVFIDTKAFPTMTVLLLFGAGSRYETKKNNGIAHFFEHMVFKGSKKYPNFFAIASLLEGMGASHNAFTAKDHTGYWVKAPVEHFEKVIDVLADITLYPLLAAEEIQREKGVIIQEINMYEDTPYRRVAEYFEQLLYKQNPLGMDTIGSKETVSSFKRGDFVDYMSGLYQPGNAVLVVAGGLTQVKNEKLKVKNCLKIIEEKFAGWKNGEKIGFIPVDEKQEKPQLFIKHKKTEQTHFTLGFRTFSFFDKRKYSLLLLATILGGGASSRLFIEVRERRGLCYYISTGRESYHDSGYMATQAGVANNLENIKRAVETILKEHKKIAKEGVKDEELNRAKEMVKGRLLLSLEDSSNVASLYGVRLILEGEIKTPEEIIRKIDRVTKNQVVDLAREIIRPEKLNFALIGPFEEVDFKGLLW